MDEGIRNEQSHLWGPWGPPGGLGEAIFQGRTCAACGVIQERTVSGGRIGNVPPCYPPADLPEPAQQKRAVR